jgi:hypothetical protein
LRVERLPAGEYSFDVHERFLEQGGFELFAAADRRQQVAQGSFRIEAGRTTTVEIPLDGPAMGAAGVPARIAGSVTLDGRPLAGVQLALIARREPEQRLSARSDERGRYELEGVQPGAHDLLLDAREMSAPPFGPGFQHGLRVALAGGESRVLDFDWHSHAVELEVRGALDGRAVVGAYVLLRAQGGENSTCSASAQTDELGRARLVVPWPGAWQVVARTTREGVGEALLELVAPVTRAVVELDAGVACAGELILPAGFAAEDARSLFFLSAERKMSFGAALERGGEGLRFRAVGLRPGRYDASLQMRAGSLPPLSIELPEAGNDALELRFEAKDVR